MTKRDKNEAYTPLEYILMVKRVMGNIDLDPASCEMAQTVVKAKDYYTKVEDGISLPWRGNVWLNPPYNDIYGVMGWVTNFIDEFKFGRMNQGVILVNANMETKYCQMLANECTMFAIPSRRISFLDENLAPMTSPRFSNLFAYFGDREGAYYFYKEFSEKGFVGRSVI